MDKAQIEAEAAEFKAAFEAGEMDWAELDGTAEHLADHWVEHQYAKPEGCTWSEEEVDANFQAMKAALKALGMC